jgi:hypothetical protein
MQHKHPATQRGTRGKKHAEYRVRNWSAYEAALVKRGSLAVWLAPEALAAWRAAPTRRRGAQPVYADAAIETALTFRAVFRLSLRSTEGFLRSVLHLAGIALPVPDASTLSRRERNLPILLAKRKPKTDEPLVLVVDSTGVKLYGEGEWKVRQHGKAKRRKWKKIHIAVGKDGEIRAVEVTDNDTHDATVAPKLLAQEESPVAAFIGDGAYDREPVYGTCVARGITRIVVPPRKDARIQRHGNTHGPPHPRDENLRAIRRHGRTAWKRTSGYHTRSLIESTMFRLKTMLGDRVRSRERSRQVTELTLAASVLNRLFALGMPESTVVAA